MLKVVEFLKGICIGIANVIPGFSGGTMAVILNIYEKLINGIGNLFQKPITVIKDIWAILLGMVVGIVFSIIAISKLLEIYPVPTILFFIGLIIGSIPNIYKSYKENDRSKWIDLLFFVLAIVIIVILPFISSETVVGEIEIKTVIIMFVLGIICSAAMIIPGVSGSLVLMAFGYYLFLTGELSYLFEKILKFDFTNIVPTLLVVIAFAIGALIGIVYISKIITMLFNKKPRIVFVTILGLLIASPFSLIYAVVDEYNNQIVNASPWSYVFGVLFLAIGAFLALVPSYYKQKEI